MKKILLSVAVAGLILFASDVMAQQGIGTNQADRSAALHIESAKRGLLIPRVELTKTDDKGPIVSQPANSLLVYNTNAAGSGATAVTPGFYYWTDTTNPATPGTPTGYWQRLLSSAEKVDPSNIGPGAQGDVLVTIINPATSQPETAWVDPAAFIGGTNGIAVSQVTDAATGIVKNVVKFDGVLTDNTTIATGAGKTLAISGLEQVGTGQTNPYDATSQQIVVMGPDGVLKKATAGDVIGDAITDGTITGKALLSTDLDISANGATALLKEVTVDIKAGAVTTDKIFDGAVTNAKVGADAITTDKIKDGEVKNADIAAGAVTSDKMKATIDDPANPGTQINAPVGHIPVAGANGTVTYQTIAGAVGEDLTTDGKIVIGNNLSTVTTATDAVLVATLLSIKEGSIGSAEITNGSIEAVDIKDKTITSDKLDAGTATNGQIATVVETAGVKTVEYRDAATSIGKTLTTDGKIVIGTSGASTLANAVLVDTELKIKAGSIGTTEINSITTPAAGVNPAVNATAGTVVTADGTGGVTYSTINSNVNVNNGVSKGAADVIQLGGDLIKPTLITTTGTTVTDNTLQIAGLSASTTTDTDKIMVVGADNVVRTTTLTAMKAIRTETASYTALPSDETIFVNNTADATITLPSAALNSGKVYNIKKVSPNEDYYVIISSAAGTVDGAASIEGALPHQGWTIQSDGTNWKVISRF